MIDIWAAMSTVDKAELFESMCLEADELARCGIAAREGKISKERENFLMMELRYSTELATCSGPSTAEIVPFRLAKLCSACGFGGWGGDDEDDEHGKGAEEERGAVAVVVGDPTDEG